MIVSGEEVSHVEFYVSNGRLVITHTYTNPKHRGKGYAKRVLEKVLEVAREKGLKVEATCSYAARFLEKHYITPPGGAVKPR